MQHQFNLGSAIQPPPFIPKQDPDAPMFASVEGVALPLSDEEVVFQTRGTDQAQVLTTQVLMTMDHCRPFRSLDEHVAEVIRNVPGLADPARARHGLEVLARAGMLVADADVLERSRAQTRAPAPLAAICIRACDRPDSLQRLLASLMASEQQHGVSHPFIVLDDSRDADHAHRNAALTAEFADRVAGPVRYVGEHEQERLARLVHEALPEQGPAIDSLLVRRADGFGGGRTWNIALLLTAGRRLFLLDEDFELPLKRHPDSRDGMTLATSIATPAWFHESQQAALAAGTVIEADPFDAHLAVAGRTLGEVAADGAWRLDRQALRGRPLEQMRALVGGYRIVTSFNGVRGSSGMADAQSLFLLGDATRARLCSERDAYLRNLRAENLWQGYLQARPAAQGLMTPFALDNSVLLPCTRAAGRNEDALFNTLTRFCHPHSQALHLPTTIGHVQEHGRGRDKARIGENAWRANTNTFAHETLQTHFGRCVSADSAQRLGFVADVLADIAGADEPGRIAYLREYLNYERADVIARLQKQLLEGGNAPIYWRTDVQAIIKVNAKAMADNRAPRLDDWPADLDAAGCADHLRTSMNGLAADLRAWPVLWDWAAAQGERLLESL